MPSSLHSLSIGKQLGVLIASALAGVVVLTAVFLVSERQLVMDERQGSVHQSVEAAHSLVVHFHQLSTEGKLTEAESWGWILGSGVYVDTVDSAIRARMLLFGVGGFLLVSLLLAVGLLMAGLLRQPGGEPVQASRLAHSVSVFRLA